MADADSVLSPAMADYVAKMMARPIVPTHSDQSTMHIGADDLPYIDAGDGVGFQLLHVDLLQGIWISRSRIPPGYKVIKHYHTGIVYAVTQQGRWFYAEAPEAVNSPGSYLFEPAGSLHTLCTPADQVGDTIAWFAICGANINVDDDGKIVSIYDARAALELYRGYCHAMGLDCSKLIVIGE